MSRGERRDARPASCWSMVGITEDRLRSLPARAVRRHAPARHDRDGAGAGPAAGDHGRADHRARRGDPAGDPRRSWSSCASGSASPCCSSRTTCRCWSSSPTASRSCTRGRIVEHAQRRRAVPAPRCTRTRTACSAPSRRCTATAARMTGIPGSPPDLRRPAARLPLPPALPYALDVCRDAEPVLRTRRPRGGPPRTARSPAGCTTRVDRRWPRRTALPRPGRAGAAARRRTPMARLAVAAGTPAGATSPCSRRAA